MKQTKKPNKKRLIRRKSFFRRLAFFLFQQKIVIAKWELNLFGVLLFGAGVIFGGYLAVSNLLTVFAATLNWDFSSSGDYTFDTNDIEVTGGVAQLKGAATPGVDWIANSGSDSWGARRKITFDNSASTENLTNFQVLIKLNGSRIDYSKVQDAGEDLRFTDSDGVTELDYEIERWNESGDSFVWVKIPQLDLGSTTDNIYVYYANQNASDGQDAAGVWNSDFSMVYHFGEPSGTTGADSVSDSTSNTSGTPQGGISFGETGQIGWAPDFSGGTGINAGSVGEPILTAETTISFWVKMTNYASPSRQNPLDQAYGGWGTMTVETNGRISWYFGSNGGNASPYAGHQSGNMVTNENGNWVYVTAVRDPDGYTYKWYKDGAYLSGTTYSSTYPVITTRTLTIGDGYVNPLNGIMDEFRVSQTARSAEWIEATYLSETDALISSVGSETTLYPTDNPTIVPNTGQGYSTASAFAQTLGAGSAGNFGYQISPDNGTTWYWYTGGVWTITSSGYAESNTAAVVNSNISSFSAGSTPKTFKWKVYLNSDGGQLPKLDNIAFTYIWDTLPPDNPASVSAYSENGGDVITTDTWYNHTGPYFTWTAPDDYADTGSGEVISGVAGYWVCFGAVDCDPTAGTWTTNTNYTASSLSTGTYYLRIKSQDNAGNANSGNLDAFTYKYDATNPTSPGIVAGDPAGYTNVNSFTFLWSAGSDDDSGIAEYCYKTGEAGATESCTSDTSVASILAYQDNVNTFYVRSKDVAGNLAASYAQVNYYYNGSAPSEPQSLAVTPETSATNSFTFSWERPSVYTGSIAKYHYSINALPTALNTTETTATSIGPSAFATQQGVNTFYVVAEDAAGNVNYNAYSSIEFTANTSAPGIPVGVIVTDTSIRAQSKYSLTVTWDEPTNTGSGIDHYNIQRSDDGQLTWSEISQVSGTGYLDTGLTQNAWYCYRVISADDANAVSANSTEVCEQSRGRYYSAPSLVGSPGITARIQSAVIEWLTDREGSSFVEYGETDAYGYEQGQDDFVSAHEVTLVNLEPNTTYHYRVRWTDEDNNTGYSTDATFVTEDALSEPTNLSVTPAYNTDNSFKFTWSEPLDEGVTVQGYFYSVNSTPTEQNTSFTASTTIGPGPYATQQGTNTFYVVAIDDANNINYANYASIDFEAETKAPSIPSGLIITDASNRETKDYSIALKWKKTEATSQADDEDITYLVYRSTDGEYYEKIAELQTTGYLDVDLDNTTTYYYRVKAKDTAGATSAASSTVSDIPEGRYTTPPAIVSGPLVTPDSFSTNVVWEMERDTTSFVQFGLTEELGEEQGESELIEDHSVNVEGLQPETTYYYRIKSVDIDGNVATSTITTFTTLQAPRVSEVVASDVKLFDALITWETNKPTTTQIDYGTTTDYGFTVADTSGSLTTTHTMKLENLLDGTTYHFRPTGLDSTGNSPESSDYSFTTLTFPEVLTIAFENKSEGQTEVTWTTNVPTSSEVEYYNELITPKTQGNSAQVTEHSVLLFGLEDATTYQYKVKGFDQFGYQAVSEENTFTTLEDTTPPEITGVQSESNTIGSGETSSVQIIINWKTNEPTTSQVEYGVGLSSTDFTDQSEENAELVMDHLVVISELSPAKTYHFRTVSSDKAGNTSKSGSYTVLTSRKRESFLQLVISNLEETFSWVGSVL